MNINTNLQSSGVQEGTISFFLTPFNMIGSSNYVEFEKPTSRTGSGFQAAEDDYDEVMGY